MKKRVCFGLLLALVATLVTALPLWAISMNNGGNFKLEASGPVSVSLANSTSQILSLQVTVTNDASGPITLASLQAAVIDPWTGARILGPTPITTGLPKSLNGTAITYPPYTIPGGSTTVTVNLTIPKTLPGTYTSTLNKTLAVVIYALDNTAAATVQGVTGWGFIVNP